MSVKFVTLSSNVSIPQKMTQDTSILNGLRAFAAYWVLITHCMIWAGWSYWGPFPNPKIAVDVFMVISGFLMAHTVSARELREPMRQSSSWLRFYARRFFRLAPAYYVSLLLAVVLASPFLGGYASLQAMNPEFWAGGVVYDPGRIDYTAKNILLHLTFVFGLHPTYSFSTFLPDWSLSLEMQFYAVFPFIFLAMRRFGAGKVAFALAVLSYGSTWALNAAVGAGYMTRFYEPSLLILRLPIFVVGVLIHEASETQPHEQWRRAIYIALAMCFCLVMAASYKLEVLWLVIPAALMAIMLLPVQRATAHLGFLRCLCRTRVVTFLSEISYSVYLLHGFFIAIVGSRLARVAHEAGYSVTVTTTAVIAAVTLLTTLFAFVSYRLVELPGIRFGAAILRRNLKSVSARPSV